MRWREWLGIGERRWKKAHDEEVQPAKTLWDWLQLLIVPAILIGVTFAWSATQTRGDNKREDRRIAADRAAAKEARRDGTLQAYLNQMSGLILDKKLLTSDETDAVRAVARTVTLTALRRLDGERKAEVVRFLYEGQLTFKDRVYVFLDGADLRGADLRGAYLDSAALQFADLERANLGGADLDYTWLDGADLRGAALTDTRLTGASLTGANLTDANLKGASLKGADLKDAHLQGANLTLADLRGAKNLDLDGYITRELRPNSKKSFLNSQWEFLASLSRDELAKFNLTPEKLADLRKKARGA